MQTVHWLGAGLSSLPGIRSLAQGYLPFVLWNRSLANAEKALAGIEKVIQILTFDIDQLAATIKSGDIIVSMLPGEWHIRIASICVDKGAHFVSSSYISADMSALDASAKQKGLCLVNEVGLDPGIDHLLAHALVSEYKDSEEYDIDNTISFRSYCGGFPNIANDFRYKFSWSPLGVLKALLTPSKSISGGKTIEVQRPWHAISEYSAQLAGDRQEIFEAYPNRDALPFMSAYHFDPRWRVEEFVRGTLRLNGWSEAWKKIFNEIDSLEGEAGETPLQQMSDKLWQNQRYEEGEADRVVLCVELEAKNDNKVCWHHSYSIDTIANSDGSAMARLVSLTVCLAVHAIATGEIGPGVSAAPSDPLIVKEWLAALKLLGEHVEYIEH